jgi:hypothetical protein
MKVLVDRGNSFRLLEREDGQLIFTVTVGGIASSLMSIPLRPDEADFIRKNPDRIDDFAKQIAQNDLSYRPRAIEPVIWD